MTNQNTPEQIEAEALARFPELDPKYASLTYPAEAMRTHNRAAFVSGATWAAAGVAPQEPSECSNPQCPLNRAHSGPCAPGGWSPDRKKLRVRYAAQMLDDWLRVRYAANPFVARIPIIRGIADILAVPVEVDETKLAEVINDALDAWQGEERSEVFVASAIAEWLRGDRA